MGITELFDPAEHEPLTDAPWNAAHPEDRYGANQAARSTGLPTTAPLCADPAIPSLEVM